MKHTILRIITIAVFSFSALTISPAIANGNSNKICNFQQNPNSGCIIDCDVGHYTCEAVSGN